MEIEAEWLPTGSPSMDLRQRAAADRPVDPQAEDAWTWIESECEALKDTFLTFYGSEDAPPAPRPSWAPQPMPSHLRRLLPILGGWFLSPYFPAPRRIERWGQWNLLCRPKTWRPPAVGVSPDYGYSDRRYAVPLQGANAASMKVLRSEIQERCLIRTSLGRSEELLKQAIAETEAELEGLPLNGTRQFNIVAGRELPVIAGLPMGFSREGDEDHDPNWRSTAYISRLRAWDNAYKRRAALLRRLHWLRRWHEVEASQGRALRRVPFPRFKQDDFTAYIKPREILRAYTIFEAAITAWEDEQRCSHDYDTTVCLGHWYRTELYRCGASWRDLRAIARRSDGRNGLRLRCEGEEKQDDKARQRAYREIYGVFAADSPPPTDYMDLTEHHMWVNSGREPWTPEYERARQLWAGRRHLARWGLMAEEKFRKLLNGTSSDQEDNPA